MAYEALYMIVDTEGEAGPKGGALPIDEDMSDAERYYEQVTKNKKPPTSGVQPTLVIMYGPPGSGKTRVLEQLYQVMGRSKDDFVHLDPDRCREFSREYRKSVSGAHAAALESVKKAYGDRLKPTEWTSADGQFKEQGYTVDGKYLALANAALRSQFLVRKKMIWGHKVVEMTDAFTDRALKEGYNVVYDTMGNEPNRFLRELMRRARSCHEYQVVVCGCYAPWKATRERTEKRTLASGRHVDESFAWKEYQAMFPKAAEGEGLPDGEVDTTHHERFAEPDNDKYKPAPFATGELKPGDVRYLFDNSGEAPRLHKRDAVGSGAEKVDAAGAVFEWFPCFSKKASRPATGERA